MIPDPCFHQGFSALGLMDGTEGHTEVTRLTCGDPDATPRWRIAAWCSRYSFADPACNARSHPREGVYVFTNPSKEVKVDTRTGTLGLFLKASEVYTDGLRQKDTPWAHLLLETDFTSMERPRRNTASAGCSRLRCPWNASSPIFTAIGRCRMMKSTRPSSSSSWWCRTGIRSRRAAGK